MGEKRKRWPALAGPGLAGVCWFVDPVRFCDWARGLDGVYLLTRRELYVPQPRPLCCCFRLVTVVVVTKSRLPKVGSPTLGSVVVRERQAPVTPVFCNAYLLQERRHLAPAKEIEAKTRFLR